MERVRAWFVDGFFTLYNLDRSDDSQDECANKRGLYSSVDMCYRHPPSRIHMVQSGTLVGIFEMGAINQSIAI